MKISILGQVYGNSTENIMVGSMDKERLLTELPLNLPGYIFRAPTPCGTYDPDGNAMLESHRAGVVTIVVLAIDSECTLKAWGNLLKDGERPFIAFLFLWLIYMRVFLNVGS